MNKYTHDFSWGGHFVNKSINQQKRIRIACAKFNVQAFSLLSSLLRKHSERTYFERKILRILIFLAEDKREKI